jgi:hypothetical protein
MEHDDSEKANVLKMVNKRNAVTKIWNKNRRVQEETR